MFSPLDRLVVGTRAIRKRPAHATRRALRARAQALGGQATNRHYKIVVISDDAVIQAFTEKMRDLYDDGGPEIQMFTTREDAARWMASQKPPPSERLSRY